MFESFVFAFLCLALLALIITHKKPKTIQELRSRVDTWELEGFEVSDLRRAVGGKPKAMGTNGVRAEDLGSSIEVTWEE